MADLIDAIAPHQEILCVSHVGPDGDAVGSLTAIGWILRFLGKRPTLALQDPIPENLHAIPGVNKIVGAGAVADAYDLIVCVDASSADRMGDVYRTQAHAGIPLVVIDHHVTNTRFGVVNWVEPGCAATCQMLALLAKALKVPLTDELAECLLTGLVTDTLGFRTSNTDGEVLAVAQELMAGGANLAEITLQTLSSRPFRMLKLLGMVLPQVDLEAGVIWATVSRQQMQTAGIRPDDELRLSGMLITTIEADISASFVEKHDAHGAPIVECSFRAKPGFNVSDLALELGGGGHPPASGCTVAGTLEQVSQRVVPMLQAARQSQIAA